MTRLNNIIIIFIIISTVYCCKKNNCRDEFLYKKDTLFVFGAEQLPTKSILSKEIKVLIVIGSECDVNDNSDCCTLKEIPNYIKDYKEIYRLDYMLSSTKEIPKEISALENLKIINLSENSSLTNISNLRSLKKLNELYLGNCSSLSTIMNTVIHLKNLKILDIEGTAISKQELLLLKQKLPQCNISGNVSDVEL